MISSAPKLICLPPAPMNGGPLDTAPVKVGEWAWEPKADDRRVIIHTPSGTIWNQYGQPSVAMRDLDKFSVALSQLGGVCAEWLDAGLLEYRHDMVRGSIVVFDAIVPQKTLAERRLLLELSFEEMPWATHMVGTSEAHDRVFLIPQFIGEAQGHALYKALREQNEKLGRKFYEGVVTKRLDSLYPTHNSKPKTECAAWVKHRFDQ